MLANIITNSIAYLLIVPSEGLAKKLCNKHFKHYQDGQN